MWKNLTCLFLLFAGTLTAEISVLAFAGSTRDGSYNKALVNIAANIAMKKGAKVTVIDLKDNPMPFYDAGLEKAYGLPKNARYLRNLMIESDAIIIATPEYNGSISAVLKNAIDWASRSEDGKGSRDAFLGKKFALISASPGSSGGARSIKSLQEIIQNVGGTVVSRKVSIPNAYNAFKSDGTLKDADVKKALCDEVNQLFY